MEGVEGIPVGQAGQSSRHEHRRLFQLRRADRVIPCLELEPGVPGQLHFGPQADK